MPRIIGIDPGLAETGWGLIDAEKNRFMHVNHGVISTKASLPTGERLKIIYDRIIEVINLYKPSEAGVECLFFAKNIKSAMPVAQARGVVLLALENSGIKTCEYKPQEIKQALVGHGQAEKHQVQELVRLILGLAEVPNPDHASDALAGAICHYNTSSSPAARK